MTPIQRPLRQVLVAFTIASTAGCGTADQVYVKAFGGYTKAELKACVDGLGGELAIALRGKKAATDYCTCTLTAISKKFTLKDRQRLASDSYVAEHGLLGLGSAEYRDWVSTNTSARATCISKVIDPDARR